MKFKITYIDADGETRAVTKEFEDSPGVTAEEWAEDYAYSLADKGEYSVKPGQKT